MPNGAAADCVGVGGERFFAVAQRMAVIGPGTDWYVSGIRTKEAAARRSVIGTAAIDPEAVIHICRHERPVLPETAARALRNRRSAKRSTSVMQMHCWLVRKQTLRGLIRAVRNPTLSAINRIRKVWKILDSKESSSRNSGMRQTINLYSSCPHQLTSTFPSRSSGLIYFCASNLTFLRIDR